MSDSQNRTPNLETSALDSMAESQVERTGAEPTSAGEGRMIAVPRLDLDATPKSKTDQRAERMLLTGAAAKSAATLNMGASLTPGQLAWRKLKKNKLAVASLWILIFMYVVAIFAQFVAPYDYETQDATATFRPPQAIHWMPAPVVYDQAFHFDQYHDFVYTDNTARPHRLRLFVHGTRYKFWDLIPTNVHLFGISGNQRVYLLGNGSVWTRLLEPAVVRVANLAVRWSIWHFAYARSWNPSWRGERLLRRLGR